MKLKCKAKIDAGVVNYKLRGKVSPVDTNDKTCPLLGNGKPVHGDFIIVKGELYNVDAKTLNSLGAIFEEVKGVKSDGKNK